MKAASHFLRNQGAQELAIIDVHILKFLEHPPPKNRREYLALEALFKARAQDTMLTPAELDVYLWKIYSKTPWADFVY
jgi:thermostable 8-oxoguanine DNA glycosylase